MKIFERVKIDLRNVPFHTTEITFSKFNYFSLIANFKNDLIKAVKRENMSESLVGISGLFKYDNLSESLLNKKVIIEITYNGRGYCQWKKNKIIQLI